MCFERVYFAAFILCSYYIDEIKPISKVDLSGEIKKTVLKYSLYSTEKGCYILVAYDFLSPFHSLFTIYILRNNSEKKIHSFISENEM